ncbi:putative NADPH2 dehydrogenase chain OYE2 [Calocera viscosa TUFC12733]|uniref:Putative NADPH2 dehydrogenase chain OYE2 n=1 Tax=Calocera viscosa (strain TUFC12733) TaxID=1330018 RepID=A0A167P2B4_CALVF|nr:putative NADPH2 dehydrogenase chain OYE2 [Calocera viscosa TUFC12733]
MGDAADSIANTALFTPLKVGNMQLQHRIAMAPLTRFRGHPDHTPSEMAITYYAQRASFPGTLLITEATFIAEEAGGYRDVPGIYTQKHIDGWKKITDAVHAKGSFIYLQLWALGRAADPGVLKEYGVDVVSSSNLPIKDHAIPRPLTQEEIKKYVGHYVTAAKNAVEAGFDGVEIHCANGYLIDQFIQDVANKRTDEYGGSIENRCRFALEVADAVSSTIGQERTGIRLSPWGVFQSMRMADPIPTFSYLAEQLKTRFPDFAYLHVVEPEPRVQSNADFTEPVNESNDFLRKIWAPKVLLSCGGFNDQLTKDVVPRWGDVIVYGRYFISNPDLPLRIKKGIPFTASDQETWYSHGSTASAGYIDYPTAEEQEVKA